MPFTFSHPAVVLSLAYLPKKWISLTGLVIGSMVPDFEYFLRMKISSHYSHSIAGIFWFDLPLALMLSVLFHNLVRSCLFQNLPSMLSSRLLCFDQLEWTTHLKRHWPVVILSILVGTSSHILWDGFTHPHGPFVESIPWLRTPVTIAGHTFPVYNLLQHFSTLAGGIVLFIVLFRLPANPIASKTGNPAYWIIVSGIMVMITGMRWAASSDILQPGNLFATWIAAGMISLVLAPLLVGKIRFRN